jgi:NifU-like protein involved in Fe-S cluster formation
MTGSDCTTAAGDDDDALFLLYNRELMALSAQVSSPKCLNRPDAKATAVSAVCGSEVTVELLLEGDKVAEIGYAVEACALTKAVVAIMVRAVPGKDRAEIARAREALQAMMEGKGAPGGDWAELKILAPVVDYKSRHDTIMLPFEAIEKAFELKK